MNLWSQVFTQFYHFFFHVLHSFGRLFKKTVTFIFNHRHPFKVFLWGQKFWGEMGSPQVIVLWTKVRELVTVLYDLEQVTLMPWRFFFIWWLEILIDTLLSVYIYDINAYVIFMHLSYWQMISPYIFRNNTLQAHFLIWTSICTHYSWPLQYLG